MKRLKQVWRWRLFGIPAVLAMIVVPVGLLTVGATTTGCQQYHQICWVECPFGLPCHESCVLVPN